MACKVCVNYNFILTLCFSYKKIFVNNLLGTHTVKAWITLVSSRVFLYMHTFFKKGMCEWEDLILFWDYVQAHVLQRWRHIGLRRHAQQTSKKYCIALSCHCHYQTWCYCLTKLLKTLRCRQSLSSCNNLLFNSSYGGPIWESYFRTHRRNLLFSEPKGAT